MKKYVITGALGHISKPIAEALVKDGHKVVVITSNKDRVENIEQLGATAAVGSVTDVAFLKEVFKDADAAYLMIPPNFTTDHFLTYAKQVADNYIAAIKESSIRYVVQLSSIGAHLKTGAGPIDGLAYLEGQLTQLIDVHVKMLRPGYFFYNFYTMLDMIKHAGIMGSNFGGTDEKIVLSHHLDIAAKAIEYLGGLNFTGHSAEYIVSDVRQANDIASITGSALGKGSIPWVTFPDDDARKAMLDAGLNPDMAENYVTMGKAFREGRAQEHFWEAHPVIEGKHKLEDFVKELGASY